MTTTQCLEAFVDFLGQENVCHSPSMLASAERATFLTQQAIPAILRPGSVEEVQECCRLANRIRLPLYPISGGKNWGYGSRVPVESGCALLDLSRLNRIVDFDEELAYVTVEPGVTQRQLYDFLRQQRSRLWMDATGSSPDSSLIGNTMERGFGHTPYGARFAHVCRLEVVLPSGELIRTGFGRFANSQAAHTYQWGMGPVLDGLFSQSNLGIVTQMTLWLMPAPEYFQSFSFTLEREEQLPAFIDSLRPLRMDGTLKSAIHLGNSYKVLSAIRQYPWQETGGVTPLSSEIMGRFRKTWKLSAWSGSGGIYGTKNQVAEARRLLKKALQGKVQKLQFLDDRTLCLAEKIARPYQLFTGLNLSELLKLLRPVYGLMQGIPTETQLASTYWRKKTTPPAAMNPDRDGCGLLWCAPVAPLAGCHAHAIDRIVHEIVPKHGFEPIISMTLLTERSLSSIITIAYDRDIEGEDRKAMAAYEELLASLTQAGYYPYRLGIQSMSLLNQAERGYQKLLGQIKTAIDPNNILAPGRYGLSAESLSSDR
jgi:4-cresol dehydrogenase (hydroxylating)